MTCYKPGGCGPYEPLSCGECPASKPEYLNSTTGLPAKEESKVEKPRLAVVLGVEVGEEFTFHYPYRTYDRVCVNSDGILRERNTITGAVHRLGSNAVCWLINHPESIMRTPRLTEPEIAIMRALGATLVIRDKTNTSTVLLFKEEPKAAATDACDIPDASDPIPEEAPLAIIDCQLFPSLAPGSGARL